MFSSDVCQNPIVTEFGSSCTLASGFCYCVQINFQSSSSSSSVPTWTASPTPTTFSTTTKSVSSASTTTSSGNGVTTPTPFQANMTTNCNAFHQVVSGDTCAGITTAAGISLSDFYSWNPAVGSSCSGLWLGYYVCVGIIGGTTTTTPPATTTSSSNGITTPTPFQANMTTNCNAFHLVAEGDGCQSIATAAGISLSDFYSWNPAVGSSCSNLWLGYYVCVGVIGFTPTTSPPATTTTPGNGIPTPTPTQTGMNSNCNSFHEVASGDTCESISTAAGISLSDFYSWNPAVGNTCSSLWLGYYVCIGVIGFTPTPTTVSATTTTPGNGISTPTPTQTGMVSNCDAFHLVVSGDTCDSITTAAGISLSDFYSWNPAVGNTCASLWLGYYVCIGIL